MYIRSCAAFLSLYDSVDALIDRDITDPFVSSLYSFNNSIKNRAKITTGYMLYNSAYSFLKIKLGHWAKLHFN